MRVLIVGAGIGGLTAALALRQAGLDVHVYEQAGQLREVGAGVAISPNAVKVLDRMGLGEALRAVAVVSESLDSRDWRTGELLGRVPLGTTGIARWGAPLLHLHRADLHDALRSAVGDPRITLGARCVGVDQDAGAVRIRCADGRDAEGDLLVGADGVHSVVREHVAGADQPTWSRQISWRGLAPAAIGVDSELEVRHHSFWGPRKQFVCFYVSAGRLVNWVANVQSDDDWQQESWSARGDRRELLDLTVGWHPQVRALIAGTESVFKWALFDRLPLDRWTRGRVTLLGDAAHPMLPFMAQGASQSIEDAYVLARCLRESRDEAPPALEAYAAFRRERAAAVQAASRDAARMIQLSSPADVQARNARLAESDEAPIDRFDWIWRYDVKAALDER